MPDDDAAFGEELALREGERRIAAAPFKSFFGGRGGILITTQRVIRVRRRGGGQEIETRTFPLDKIDTVEMTRRQEPVWLLAAGALLVGAVVAGPIGLAVLAPLAAFLAIVYFWRRATTLVIYSGRSKTRIPARGAPAADLRQLVDRLEAVRGRSSPDGRASIEARLAEAVRLREGGHIDDREFAKIRANILGDL